jgi:hypothetical protein
MARKNMRKVLGWYIAVFFTVNFNPAMAVILLMDLTE